MTRLSPTATGMIMILLFGLQVALERFAKRWYQRRALRVFRDEASLAADPALWESIEQALSASKWFVDLAVGTGAKVRVG